MGILTNLRVTNALNVSLIVFLGWVFSHFPKFGLDFVLVVLSVIFFNVFVFLYNDLLDAPFDAKDKKKRKRNVFCNTEHLTFWKTVVLLFGVSTFVLLLAVSVLYFIVALFMITMNVLYSGPIFRAKSRKFFDVIFHGLWPIPAFFLGYHYFFGFDSLFVALSVLFFMASVIGQLNQEIRDYVVDKKTKQDTTVIWLKRENSVRIRNALTYLIFLIPSAIFVFLRQYLFLLVSLPVFFWVFLNVKKLKDFERFYFHARFVLVALMILALYFA